MEKKKITKNGLEIYSFTNPAMHSFCISLNVLAGCLYESDDDNGITHFMEHILFRNLNYLMDGKLYETVDRLGLNFNGGTYKEFVRFTIEGAPKNFEAAAEIISKLMDAIVLPSEEIKIEQQRVKSEIRENDDFKSLDYFAGCHVWEGTSLRNTIIGPVKNINRLGRKRLQEYQRIMFQPHNIFFYVTGNVSDKQLDYLATMVNQIELGTCEELTERNNIAPIPRNFGKRQEHIFVKNSPYILVQFSFDIDVSKFKDSELMLLYDILLSGDSCLLQQELSEKTGMVYSFSAFLEKYRNIGQLTFKYEVRKNNLLPSIEIVCACLSSIKDDCSGRLEIVLPAYVDNAYMILDDYEDLNWNMSYVHHILQHGEASIEKRIEEYQSVTEADIARISKEIFHKKNLVLAVKGKKGKWQLEAEEIIEKYL